MVTIGRVNFERKLNSINSVLSTTAKKYPLLGLVQDGTIKIWQDGDMPIWNEESIDTEENFSFSVLVPKLREIVGGFKGQSIDLVSDGRGAITVKSGRSRVSIPYVEGIYDEIPRPPTLEVKCTTNSDFLKFLSTSSEFIAKTYEQASLTYSYIGCVSGNFFISGMNGFSSFTALVPFEGDTLPNVVVPSEFAIAASKLISGDDIEVGVSSNQNHIVIRDGDTTIYTPRVQQTYPERVYDLVNADGDMLFSVNRKLFLDHLKLALQTTDRDLIGIEPDLDPPGGIRLVVPRAVIDADLMVEDAKIYRGFDRIHFQLPFLIQSIGSFDSERINIEILPEFNDEIRISSDDSTAVTTVRPFYFSES